MSKALVKKKMPISGKGGPVTKKRKLEIIEELAKVIESGQILGITNTQLAKRFEIKRETVATYLKEIYNAIPSEDIKDIEIKLKVMFDRVFREVQTLLQTAVTNIEKERALKLLMDAMSQFTDYLERFGLKQKAIENIHIQQEQVIIHINTPKITNGNTD